MDNTQSPSSPTMSSPSSRTRSRSNSGRPNLSIRVPPLYVVHEEITPDDDVPELPPSNSLLITHLTQDLLKDEILVLLRGLINPHAPIWSWNLDRRRSRIKISFYDIKSARFVKEALEREPIFGCTPKITFAPQVATSPPPMQYLELPKSDKLFFISPPPSPPHGWEMRNEGPPNTDTHAHDLTAALLTLENGKTATATHTTQARVPERADSGDSTSSMPSRQSSENSDAGRGRSSSITLVYHPQSHGSSMALPSISVEDTEFCESPSAADSAVEPAHDEALMRADLLAKLRTERPPMLQENGFLI